MIHQHKKHEAKKENKSIYYFIALITVGITVLFASFLIVDIHQELESVAQYALIEGKASHNKDLLYRQWASMHGGVYVPITDETPPNPALSHIPDRDITTENGATLTLVNPAYMTRQVHEIAEGQYGVKGHITSLNPLRPENKPDEWETRVLQLFEAGESEYSSVETIGGLNYLRYMRAMTVEQSCLKCHAIQGYKVGEIRGGISVSVPMEMYDKISDVKVIKHITTYSLVFAVVLALGAWGFHVIKKEITNRQLQQTKTLESQALLSRSQELGHIGSWNLDGNTNTLIWSDEVYRIFGCDPQLFTPSYEAFLDSIHPDDRAAVDEAYTCSIREKRQGYEIEHRILRQGTAEIRYVFERCVHVCDAAGAIVQSIGMIQDITERKLAANEQRLLLQKAEQLSRAMLSTVEDQRNSKEQLLKRMEELQRFHNVTMDRELVMIELKKEINALLKQAGQKEKYHIVG